MNTNTKKKIATTGYFKKFDIILQSNNFGSFCLNDFKFT